jgi:hypothetical protein
MAQSILRLRVELGCGLVEPIWQKRGIISESAIASRCFEDPTIPTTDDDQWIRISCMPYESQRADVVALPILW